MAEEAYLKDLRGEELEAALLLAPWYVQPNDLIGGWCIMPVDEPPSQAEYLIIADVFSKELGQRIVDLHNDRLNSPYAPAVGRHCDLPHPDFPDILCHRESFHAPHAIEGPDETVLVWTDEYKGADK